LNEQLGEVSDLLRENEDAPEDLAEEARTLRSDVGDLGRQLNSARGTALRTFSSLESVAARPTPDQLWQIDDAWSTATEALPELNAAITERLPALYGRLDEHGIRPDPGAAVEVPRRPGS
jgi:hypothetical protein